MPDYLKADLTRIAQMSKMLTGLSNEFANLTTVADVGAAAGNAGLESALSDFASNWSDKRNDLINQLQQLSGLSAEAVAAYKKTDATLTQALTRAGQPTPGPSRPGPEGGPR